MLEEESSSCFGVTDDTSVLDPIHTKDFFADFDLDEMSALEEGDLSLLSDPQKVRQLAEALSISPSDSQSKTLQMHGSCSSNLPSDIFRCNDLRDKDARSFASKHNNSPPISNNNNNMFLDNNNTLVDNSQSNEQQIGMQLVDDNGQPLPPPLPPVVISPTDIDSITVQLEKNQQCACKDCGKLFNSVWYLKQHAVKHSNDRPFKCKFCMKTYKFRSNLYQHKCPERNRHMGGVGQTFKKKFYTRGIAYTEMYNGKAMDAEGNPIKLRSTKNRHKTGGGEGGGGLAATTAPNNNASNYDNINNPFLDSQSTPAISSIFGNGQESNNGYAAGQTLLGNSNGFEMQSPRYPIMSNSQGQNSMFFENNLLNNNHNLELAEENNNTSSALGSTTNLIASQQQQYEDPFCTPNNGYMSSQFGGQNTNSGLTDYCDSIRQKPLDQDYINNYIQKNKHRIYSCRKCKLNFPSREHLSRHNAYHTSLDCQPFVCDQCPQRFSNEKQLSGHYLQHSDNSPHRCAQCYGTFRSALALRRHKDQSRQCYYPPFGVQPRLMISPSAPLDQFSFVDSEEEEIEGEQVYHTQVPKDHLLQTNNSNVLNQSSSHIQEVMPRKNTTDSGVGSDCSGHSFTTSPLRTLAYEDQEHVLTNSSIKMYNSQALKSNLNTESLEEEEEEEDDDEEEDIQQQLQPVKSQGIHRRDDETDSGFRSRLNSLATTTQSCSPPSSSVSSASDGGSPAHRAKVSPSGVGDHNNQHHNYGHIKYSNAFNAYSNGAGSSTTKYGNSKTTGGNYGSNYKATGLELFDQDKLEQSYSAGGFEEDERDGQGCVMSSSMVRISRWTMDVPSKGVFTSSLDEPGIFLSNSPPQSPSLPCDWDLEEQHYSSFSSPTLSCYNSSSEDTKEFAWEGGCDGRGNEELQPKQKINQTAMEQAAHMFLRHLLLVVLHCVLQKGLFAKYQHLVTDRISAPELLVQHPVKPITSQPSNNSNSKDLISCQQQGQELCWEAASSHKSSGPQACPATTDPVIIVVVREENGEEEEDLEDYISTKLSDCHISKDK